MQWKLFLLLINMLLNNALSYEYYLDCLNAKKCWYHMVEKDKIIKELTIHVQHQDNKCLNFEILKHRSRKLHKWNHLLLHYIKMLINLASCSRQQSFSYLIEVLDVNLVMFFSRNHFQKFSKLFKKKILNLSFIIKETRISLPYLLIFYSTMLKVFYFISLIKVKNDIDVFNFSCISQK